MMSEKIARDFESVAREDTAGGLFRELWHLLRQNKKWFLLPILVTILLFATLMILTTTAAAPFIYTLF